MFTQLLDLSIAQVLSLHQTMHLQAPTYLTTKSRARKDRHGVKLSEEDRPSVSRKPQCILRELVSDPRGAVAMLDDFPSSMVSRLKNATSRHFISPGCEFPTLTSYARLIKSVSAHNH